MTLVYHMCLPDYLLQRMGDEVTCRIWNNPSLWGMLTLKASLARVLFFLEPATPIRASTSALRSFKIPTQSTLWTNEQWFIYNSCLSVTPATSEFQIWSKKCLRKCHISAGLQGDLNHSGSLDVHLLAGCCVASCHSACLVEAMRFHSASVVGYKHLQHDWFTHTFQLGTKIHKLTAL